MSWSLQRNDLCSHNHSWRSQGGALSDLLPQSQEVDLVHSCLRGEETDIRQPLVLLQRDTRLREVKELPQRPQSKEVVHLGFESSTLDRELDRDI